MQNCYNTNARGGPAARTAEDAQDVDERLTRRHLETLQFAQEMARQNRELKASADKLEAQLADCGPTHQLADEAQQRLLDMQEQCNQRVDEMAKRLSEQHEREMAAVLQDRADDERAWYAARQREQAELLKLQMALRDRQELAGELEARLRRLDAALAAEAAKAAGLEAASAAATEERDAARKALASAEARQRASEAARHEVGAARQKCAELQLRLDQLLRDREADAGAEAERQRCLDDCQRELRDLRLAEQRLEQRLAESDQRLASARRSAEAAAAENLALRAEVAALKAQLQPATPARGKTPQQQQPPPLSPQQQQQQQQPGDANFREFVAVKRELSALREENERLRARMMRGGGGPSAAAATATSAAAAVGRKS